MADENPEYAVERMLEELEQAGLASQYNDPAALAAGKRTAWNDLFQSDLTQPFLSRFLGEEDTFPLKLTADGEMKAEMDDMCLEDWAGRATTRFY